MFGPVIGAFLLGAILLGMTLMGIGQFVEQIITGAILLAAVGYDRLLVLKRQQRRKQICRTFGEEGMQHHSSMAAASPRSMAT